MIASLDELTSWSSMSVPLAHAAAINPLSRTEANALAFTRYPFDLGFTKIINIDRKSCSRLAPSYFHVRMRDMCTRACESLHVLRALCTCCSSLKLLACHGRVCEVRLVRVCVCVCVWWVCARGRLWCVCAFGACARSVRVCVQRVCAFGACVRWARMWLSPVSAIVAIAVLIVSIRDSRRFESRQRARGSHLTCHGHRDLGRFFEVTRSFRGWPRPCNEYDS